MSRYKKNAEDDPRPFNAAIAKLERINDLWYVVDKAKIQGLNEEYFEALECIYRTSMGHLNEKERDKCRVMIKDIERFLDSNENIGSIGGAASLSAIKINSRQASNKADEFAEFLVLLLHKYKLEWLDIKEWEDFRRKNEPIMRG